MKTDQWRDSRAIGLCTEGEREREIAWTTGRNCWVDYVAVTLPMVWSQSRWLRSYHQCNCLYLGYVISGEDQAPDVHIGTDRDT